MHRKILIIIFGIILASCIANHTSPSPAEIYLPTQPVNFTSSVTKQATATNTFTPAATNTPTASNTPEPTPTITATPLPWANTIISSENAHRIVLLASWGRGNVIQYEKLANNRILVLSTLGVYLYQQQDFHLKESFLYAIRYLISPNQESAALIFPDGVIKLIDLDNGEVQQDLIYQPIIKSELICPECDPSIIEQYIKWYYTNATLAFSPDNRMLAFGAADGAVVVWNLEDGSLKTRLYHDSAGMDGQILFTNDSKNLISIGRQPLVYTRFGSLTYWSLDQEKMVWYQKADGRLSSQLISPDNSVVGLLLKPAGSKEDIVRLYNAKEGDFIGQINGQLSTYPYSSDSKMFVSFHPNNVLIWQVQPTYQLVRTIYPKIKVESAAFSDDGLNLVINGGELAYSVSDYQEVREGEAHLPEPAIPFSISVEQFYTAGHVGYPLGIELNHPDNLFIWGGSDTVWRWEPLTGDINWVKFDSEPLALPAISSGGNSIAACFDSGLVIKEISNQDGVTFDRCLSNGVVAFSPDGKELARSISNQIKTINHNDGTTIQDYIGPGYPITWLEYSPDGNFLASGGEVCSMSCKGDLHLWNTSKAHGVTLEADGSEWPVTDVVFSSDGNYMIVAKTFIWIWDTRNGRLLGRFPAGGSVLALSQNDELLAVGDYEGRIHLMALADRKEIASFAAHQTAIKAIAFKPDGANIVSAAADGSVNLWGIP